MSGFKVISNIISNKEKILDGSLTCLSSHCSYDVKVGFELEAYLVRESNPIKSEEVESFIVEFSRLDSFPIELEIERERGISQIEVKSDFISDLSLLCDSIILVKEKLSEIAEKNGYEVDFSARVFDDDCPSALQFSYSFHDIQGQNILIEDNKLFENSISGIISLIDEMMIFMISKEEDLARFDLEFNKKLFKSGKFIAPVNICYGSDNRTSLIRYFRSVNNLNNRVEFRAVCADSDPYLALSCLLFAISYGVKNNLTINEDCQIYGNSFDEKYDFRLLMKSYQEIENKFLEGDICGFFVGVQNFEPQH